jgi:hypothetical protein
LLSTPQTLYAPTESPLAVSRPIRAPTAAHRQKAPLSDSHAQSLRMMFFRRLWWHLTVPLTSIGVARAKEGVCDNPGEAA